LVDDYFESDHIQGVENFIQLHIENLALAPILILLSEDSGVQEVVQNISDFFKGQIKVRDDVENQILVVKGIYLHRLFYPGESFGVILTKTKKEFKKKERGK
jgi:hypothetical protein